MGPFLVQLTMIQITIKSRVWTIFQRQSVVPSPIRANRPWPKPGFYGPKDHGPNLAFLVQCSKKLYVKKWNSWDQEKRYRDHRPKGPV
jgi:hypothetical protein